MEWANRHLARHRLRCFIAAVALAVYAPNAIALTWTSPAPLWQELPQSRRSLTLHPFSDNGAGMSQGFGLFDRGQVTFEEAVRTLLRGEINHPMIEMRSADVSGGFSLTSGAKMLDYRFFVAGVPLCGFQLRAHQLADRSSLILGSVPILDPQEPTPTKDWPDADLVAQSAIDAVAATSGQQDIKVAAKLRCFVVAHNSLSAAWNLTVYAAGLPYQVLADAHAVLSVQPVFFDVDGSGQVFARNKYQGNAQKTVLTDLVGDGSLTSPLLQTVVPAGYQAARASNEVFNFDPSDRRFDEVQAYAHTQAQLDWFLGLGFQWYGPQPVQIKLHVKPAGLSNNALFIPGNVDSGTLPSINIDDGDGITLQNLATDADVVSHELGHHIVFKTLHSTAGESLVLHEGMADFFAFARTGDPCLGESICPAGSGACIVPGQCLRTAENALVYNDQDWQTWEKRYGKLGHLHGQIVSGLLWDLRKDGLMTPDDVTHLAVKTISYFKEDSGLRDFLLAVLTADKDLFQCHNSATIRSRIQARGLTEFIADVAPGCGAMPLLTGGEGGALQSSDPAGNSAPKTGSANHDSSAQPKLFGTACGVISNESGSLAGLLALFSLPIVLFTRRRR